MEIFFPLENMRTRMIFKDTRFLSFFFLFLFDFSWEFELEKQLQVYLSCEGWASYRHRSLIGAGYSC